MGNSKIVYYGETLIDLTGDTVEAAKLLKGVTAHDKKGEKVTGTLADVAQATPAITVDAAGKITASATQAAGVVTAGTKSATKQLTVQAAKTVTPSASAQTAVAKGVFTTGIITVAAVYAAIRVTYPSGSTCTCTSGSTTLRAKDTSGTALFIITAKGTWTVKAVKGSQSVSKAVSITADGQVATVTLSYSIVLFANGVVNTEYGGLKNYNVSESGGKGQNTLTYADKLMVCYAIDGGDYSTPSYRAVYIAGNKIDLTGRSTVKMTFASVQSGQSAGGKATPYIFVSTEYTNAISPAAYAVVDASTTTKTVSLDVSKLTGQYYVGLFYQVGLGNATAKISNFEVV